MCVSDLHDAATKGVVMAVATGIMLSHGDSVVCDGSMGAGYGGIRWRSAARNKKDSSIAVEVRRVTMDAKAAYCRVGFSVR